MRRRGLLLKDEQGEELGFAAGAFGGGLGELEEVGEFLGEAVEFLFGDVLAVGDLAESQGAVGALEGAGEFAEEAEVGLVVEVGEESGLLFGEPAHEGDGGGGGFERELGGSLEGGWDGEREGSRADRTGGTGGTSNSRGTALAGSTP